MAKQKVELSPQEVKEKLKAGEEIKDAIIPRLTLGKHKIDFPIHIVDCEIGTLDLNKAEILEDLTIRRCKIDMCVFSEAIAHKKFDMKKCRISRGRFQRVHFKQLATFTEAVLAYCSFHKSTFDQKADFNRATFQGDATFTEATFNGMANFIHVRFKERALFHQCEWKDKVDFKNIDVSKDLELNRSHFHGDLLLNGAVVGLSIELAGAKLEGHTSFAKVTAGRSLSLFGVKVGEKQGFRFSNASAGSILLERKIVEGHVFPENDGDHLGASKEYGFLRTVFADINRFEDEDWAYYQFKRTQRRGTSNSNPIQLLKKLGNYLFLDLGCGYGTKPFRTLIVCAVMVVFFAAIYLFGGVQVPEGIRYGFSSHTINNILHAFNTSLLAFSGSYGDVKVTGVLKILAMFEYMLGVVFMGLFVVAFSRKVIR